MNIMNTMSLMATLFFFAAFSVAGMVDDKEKATPTEVVQKVCEAVSFLSMAGESGLKAFNERNGPWVFKDTYVFVFDCGKGEIVAHPVKPKLIGKNLMGLKDIKGNYFFAQLCDASKKPGGGWVAYWWPKVGESPPSRKISLLLQVPNSPYQVGAGIYDDNQRIEELEKVLTSPTGTSPAVGSPVLGSD